MKRFLIVVLVICSMLSAAFVDKDTAKKAAENYYRNYAPAADKGNAVTNIISHEYEGQVTWYGINFEKGFVIINAEDALRPILGYSFESQIPDENRPGGYAFKEWFGYYDKQIKVARKYSYVDAEAQKTWKDINNNNFEKASKSVVVDGLVDSKWDQVWPWNDLCPEKDGTWTYVGCVATAASMIIRYHEWPPTATGSHYNSSAGTTENYGNYNFDYSVMEEVVEIEYGLYPEYWETVNMDAAAIQNLAELNYLTGHSFDMSYGTTADGGSGANMNTASNALQTYWYYNTNYSSVGTPTDPTAYASTIRAELDAKRPWWWAGGVHSFILDGYTDDYWYHFNWGWEGSYDGWFQITSLVPGGTGSGGGDEGDYTTNQIMISCTPNTNPFTSWPAPTSFSGSIANINNVTLSWNSPSGSVQSYNIFRSVNQGEATLLGNTTATSYDDLGLTENTYTYYVTAVYADAESHHTSSWEAVVAADPAYPVARGLAAVANGRTSIDLNWIEPYVGILNGFLDYEDGLMPAGWIYQTSDDGVTTGPQSQQHPGCWYGDDGNCAVRHKDEFSNWLYQDRIDGYIMILSTAAYPTFRQWWLSPLIDVNADHTLSWWMRFRCTDDTGADSGNYPAFDIVAYDGDFTEEGRETTIPYTTIATFVCSVADENVWEWEESVSLAAVSGQNTRIGFRVYENPYYTFSLDRITLGSTSGGGDDPTGYEVYRDGALITTIGSGTTYNYSDTGFADGNNEYFLKALYPTGNSIAGKHSIAFMDANPKPDYLSGVGSKGSADLSWYAPYHNAPKWYTYIDPEDGMSTTTLEDIDMQYRRTIFTAEDMGFFYPVTIDSIAAVFYDDAEGNWSGENTFTFRIFTGDPLSPTVHYTSPSLTAFHNQITTHALGTPLELSEDFNIEVVTTAATGNPTCLMGKTPNTHSYFQYDPGDGLSYSYGIVYTDGDWGEWCHLAYITSAAAPPIAKEEGWVSSAVDPMIVKEKEITALPEPHVSSKALDHYKIYRDGVEVGTSTILSYSDTSVPVDGTYNYYVTASYANPAGESLPSNDIDLYVTSNGGGPIIPAVPANVTTAISGSDLVIDWDDSADATGYDVYSSDDPYGTFAWEASVTPSTYTVAADQAKLFYYIKATNATKTAPEKVERSAEQK